MSFPNGGADKGLQDRPLPAGYLPLHWQGGFRPLPGVGDVGLLGCKGQPCGSPLQVLGWEITYQAATAVKEALDVAGVESGQYSGHSFRIGAATTAAARGLEDSTVRTLGRWKSLSTSESHERSWQTILPDCASPHACAVMSPLNIMCVHWFLSCCVHL